MILMIVVGIALIGIGIMWRNDYAESNSATETYELLAGDSTHPGYRALSIDMNKGEILIVQWSSDTSVNYVIVDNSIFENWVEHYLTQNINDQPNYDHGWKMLSGTVQFTAPNQGKYDVVFLNENPVYAHVTVTPSLKVPLYSFYRLALIYAGTGLIIVCAIIAAYLVGSKRK